MILLNGLQSGKVLRRVIADYPVHTSMGWICIMDLDVNSMILFFNLGATFIDTVGH